MKWKLFAACYLAVLGFGFLLPSSARADTSGDFNLQVTPSPIVATVKPGAQTKLTLKLYDGGVDPENLTITTRSFDFDSSTGQVELSTNTPASISSWISFSDPSFTIDPGQWFTQTITLNIPKDAGFSYSFALVVSQQNSGKPTSGTRTVKGSLAVFTLLNIDRPGATSDLKVVSFTSSKKLYEYLPASLTVRFRNNGNTISQPSGNIFIGRSGSKTAVSTLLVNSGKGYVLPGTSRNFTSSWNDGFPNYQTTSNPDGSTSQNLTWDWGQLAHMRIGKYTASLVAVYSQGGYDVPIEGQVSFWVVPWKILLALLVVILLILFALFILVRAVVRFIKRGVGKKPSKQNGADA